MSDIFEQSSDCPKRNDGWKQGMEEVVKAEKQYQGMIERVTGTEESQTL